MGIVRNTLLAASLSLVVTGAHSVAEPASTNRARTTTPAQRLQAAAIQLQNNDLAGAYAALKQLIARTDFAELSSTQQHHALHLAGLCANELGDYVQALAYLTASTAMPEATGGEWHARVSAAYRLGNTDELALGFTTIARRWPESLPQLRDLAILSVIRQLRDQGKDDAWQELVSALFNTGWKVSGAEPSWLWAAYAERLVEQGNFDRAAAVSLLVDKPHDLIAMRVDLRFAHIVKKNAEHFDIDRAVAAEMTRLEAAVQKAPDSLETLTDLTYALLASRRYDKALELCDQALARAVPPLGQSQPYTDANEFLIWIMDNRARALRGLGRHDEAVAQLERATRRPESGHINVSNAINLGNLYCQLDRADDALRAIEDVRETSPFGRMQFELVRQCAALIKGDTKTAASAFDYLREHRSDAEGGYQEALIAAQQLDEAATLLIERLNAGRERGRALLEVQRWVSPPGTPRSREMRRRWDQVLQRPDVQSAIRKVGRIESFSLTEPLG